jgi:hypothetical protein
MPKRGLRPSGGRRSLRPRSLRGQLVSDYGQRITPRHEQDAQARHSEGGGELEAHEPAVTSQPTAASGPTQGVSRALLSEINEIDEINQAPSQVAPSANERGNAPALEHALSHAHEDDAHLLADFFSSPPPAADGLDDDEDAFDEHEVLRMSRGSRRAMWASLGLFGTSVLAIGGFIAYHQLVMPAPVELTGANEGLSPLQPLAARPETSISAASDSTQPRYLLTAAATNPQPSAAAQMVLPGEEPAAAPGVAEATAAADGVPPAAAAAIPSSANSAPVLADQASPRTSPDAQLAAASAAQPSAAKVGQLGAANLPARAPAAQAVNAQPAAASPTSPAGPSASSVLPVPVQPLASGNSPEPTFDELLAVAHSFGRRGNNQTALEAFEHALRVRPDAPSALSGKALIYLNMEDTQTAKLFASRAVAADPTNSEGWIVLGAAEEQLGSRDAAREAYRHCAEQGVGSYVVECRQLVR